MGVGLVIERGESLGQGLERFGLLGRQGFGGFEQFAVEHRANREAVFVMLDVEAALAGIEAQLQGAFLQRHAVVATQERQQ